MFDDGIESKQFIYYTVNELVVDVSGVLSSTVDTTILIFKLNTVLLVIVKVPVEESRLNGDDEEYKVPSELYAV